MTADIVIGIADEFRLSLGLTECGTGLVWLLSRLIFSGYSIANQTYQLRLK